MRGSSRSVVSRSSCVRTTTPKSSTSRSILSNGYDVALNTLSKLKRDEVSVWNAYRRGFAYQVLGLASGQDWKALPVMGYKGSVPQR